MRNILLTTMIILLTSTLGCAIAPRSTDQTPSTKRKAELQKCVSTFLAQDVSPVDSLNICSSIYSRWEATTTRQFSNTEPVKRSGR